MLAATQGKIDEIFNSKPLELELQKLSLPMGSKIPDNAKTFEWPTKEFFEE